MLNKTSPYMFCHLLWILYGDFKVYYGFSVFSWSSCVQIRWHHVHCHLKYHIHHLKQTNFCWHTYGIWIFGH